MLLLPGVGSRAESQVCTSAVVALLQLQGMLLLSCHAAVPARLSQKGVLGDLVEEWEEWQHDLMLQEIQRHNKTLASRARKHKREEPEVDLDAPRQVGAARSTAGIV